MDNRNLVNSPKIYKLNDIINLVNNVNLDGEIVVFDATLTPTNISTVPTYIDALLIILVTEGKAVIKIDVGEYEITKNSLIVLQPKNYINIKITDTEAKVHIIACSRKLVDSIITKLTDILPLLMHHRTSPVSQLKQEDAENLNSYYEFIHQQIKSIPGPHFDKKIQFLLQSALYQLADIYDNQKNDNIIHTSRKDEIMAKFIICVGENFRKERKVTYYADMLCITSKHLSAVVKKASGMTAGEWIDNYVIMEAKVLLRNTDLTIQQISDNLNFANQSFFGKYFKHLTGQTPTEYRNNPQPIYRTI